MRTFRACVSAVLLMAAVACAHSGAWVPEDYSSTIDKFKSSEQVQPFFENAYGYAVLPLIGKGGLGIGGSGAGRSPPRASASRARSCSSSTDQGHLS